MELTITPHIYGERIEPFLPDNSIYEFLGEEGIRTMISDFYDLLVQSDIKHLFPTDDIELDMAKQHAADFIVQRFGGHPYYNERRGKPLMVKRHAPFKITPQARLTWLKCYRSVLVKQAMPQKAIEEYWRFLDEFSTWMVNTPSDGGELKGFKISL